MPAGEHVIRGSLWLRPTGPILERLQELIRRLTARFGGQWPRPHVSLLLPGHGCCPGALVRDEPQLRKRCQVLHRVV